MRTQTGQSDARKRQRVNPDIAHPHAALDRFDKRAVKRCIVGDNRASLDKLLKRGDGLFREKELDARQALYDGTYLRQVRFDSPLWVCIDGRSNKGMVREGKND